MNSTTLTLLNNKSILRRSSAGFYLVFAMIISAMSISEKLNASNVYFLEEVICPTEAFINEFHYDNQGADEDEFVEVAMTAGADPTEIEIFLYNGSNGTTYANITLSPGEFVSSDGIYDYYLWNPSSVQNGAPDGIALICNSPQGLVEFLSYEGTLVATDGPASGETSIDVGVSETSSTPAGSSIALNPSTGLWELISDDSPGMANSGSNSTCGITSFGPVSISCVNETAGLDEVLLEIPYEGMDAAVSVINMSAGMLSGDDPSTVNNGMVSIQGLFEGDSYTIQISGGDCNGLEVSGSIPIDLCETLAPPSCDLYIAGILDGPLSGGTPKALQLCAISTIPDLSIYGIGSASNGGGSQGVEFTLPNQSLAMGECFWIASEQSQFEAFFGFSPDATTGVMNVNGDDAIELFSNGVLLDVFGDVNVDGTNECWEYLDSYAVRNSPGCNSTMDCSEWTFGGPNNLDGLTEYCAIVPQDPFNIGTCVTPPCGIIELGTPSISCLSYSSDSDELLISIPYSGMDAGATINNTGSGLIGGDDPSLVSDGIITISGISEGEIYAFSITGGLCDLSASGSAPNGVCNSSSGSALLCVGDSDCSQWSSIPAVVNNQFDNWTCNTGVYASNPFAGLNANEASELYLISGGLDLSQESEGSITADITIGFTGPDLQVFYSTDYIGGQNPNMENWVAMGTYPGSVSGGPTMATFPIPNEAFGNSNVVFAFLNSSSTSAAGDALDIEISNITFDIGCNTTPTCGISSIGPEEIVCSAFTSANDNVQINIPYAGLDPSAVVISSGSGSVGGNNPATENSGVITLTALTEGESYSVEISGGECTNLVISGTVSTTQCPAPPNETPELVISEIMYNESGIDDEWIELCNLEPESVDLTAYAVKVNGSVLYTFPLGSSISSNECITIALGTDSGSGDSQLFNDNCPFEPDFGSPNTTNNLSNGGATISICDQVGGEVDIVSYSSTSASSGNGSSLELIDVTMDNSDTENGNWQDGMNNGDNAPSPGLSNDLDADCSLLQSPFEGQVVISEILYDPCTSEIGADGDFEFIELTNISANAIELSSWSITGVDFQFPSESSLEASETLIITVNGNSYGGDAANVFTWNSGSLSNGGELLSLLDENNLAVDEVDYDDGNGWPTCPDNNRCASLVLIDLNSDNNDPVNWFASSEYGGSPNEINTASEQISNAFLSMNGQCNGDDVEFEITFDITGGTGTVEAILSDGTLLGELVVANGNDQVLQGILAGPTPGGTLEVILRDQGSPNCGPGSFELIDPACGIICPFDLESAIITGECVGDDALISLTINVSDGSGSYSFTGPEGEIIENQSEGIQNGVLSMSGILTGPTEGLAEFLITDLNANEACQLSLAFELPICPIPMAEVIINEIHYNPCSAQGSDSDFEFLEIYNNGNASADLSGWFITEINFTFPEGVTIAPGEYIVIAKNNENYPTPYDYSGSLGNGGDELIVLDSESNIVDIVEYDDGSGWPEAPDGDCCASLALIDFNSDNALSTSWGVNYDNGSPGTMNDLSPLMGCTNPSACNFDECATIDDGSCILIGDACDDGDSSTINDLVKEDCVCAGENIIEGCMDEMACNYNPEANLDNESCTYPGDSCDDMNENTINDIFGEDCTCMGVIPEILGCIDEEADNFDPNANTDDGSCLYSYTFSVDMNCWDGLDNSIESTIPTLGFSSVSVESPNFGWCGGCAPLSDPEEDGVWTGTFLLPLGSFEYKYAIDGFAGQENLIDDMLSGASCAPVTDFNSFANRLITIEANGSVNDTYGSCDVCEIISCEQENFMSTPFNLSEDFSTNVTMLSWTEIPASTGCQVQGGEVGGNFVNLIVQGDAPDEYPVNNQLLNNGTTYQWRVRCGCSLNPFIATPWSDWSYFTYNSQMPLENDKIEIQKVSVYPNPSQGDFNFNVELTEKGQIQVRLYNVLGEIVYSKQHDLASESQVFALSIGNLDDGMYFLEVMSQNDKMTRKVLIE
ncbi:MAG: lamin tail domain-containing protein [Bacteroidota bacterium]